ncbi:MAG: ABC transporter [Sphingobium sp. 66-54]|nr:MAG: ABC transporter [Sphingobium sp. 66-54]
MASGLAALLDDVAAIARLAAASLDDVSAAASKASMKAAGVVVDDTAVTPTYVTGFSPQRELPMIGRIALGSLRNKLLILLPVALLLSAFLPAAITPLLMIGGTFLCFEGAEKILEWLRGGHGEEGADDEGDPAQLEQAKVSGAIRTDLILSAEIMAIALSDVASRPVATQAAALVIVSLLVTAGVYGVVALIVKLDDIGLHFASTGSPALYRLGRGLVRAMPVILNALEIIGMIAMLWVGGGIIVHGLDGTVLGALPHAIHAASEAVTHNAVLGWVIGALFSAVFGLLLGLVVVTIVHAVQRARGRA